MTTNNEFSYLTAEELLQMLPDVELEAELLVSECRERFAEAVKAGWAHGSSDPACDYIADDLWQRAAAIRDELKRRGQDGINKSQ